MNQRNMNLKNYAFVALILVGFTACKKNDSNNPEQQSTGEDTKISLSFSIAPSGAKTYAPGQDAIASVDELEMNTVDIFIYDNASPFGLTHKHYEDKDNLSTDFETINGARRLKNGIVLDVKTGSKQIYVGVNLPTPIVNEIKAQGLTSLDGVYSTIELYDADNSELYATGMAMFTNEGEIATLQKTDVGGIPSVNKISFELTRVLAKVTVDGNDAFNIKVAELLSGDNLMPILGGVIDVRTLLYSLKQANVTTFLKGNSIIPSIESNDFFEQTATPSRLGLAAKYIPENLADIFLHKLTYAVVQARFIPEVFEDGAQSAYVPGSDFFTVTDTTNGSVKYFLTQLEGSRFVHNKEFRKYTNGICYYHIYLNPANDHKVIRNEHYQVKISNIKGIGKSSPHVTFKKTGNELYNPELLHHHGSSINFNTLYLPQKATTNANIEAAVSIVPWSVVASEHEL